ncbi:MAG: hypothetical protein PHC64_04565, partial [Candidatus Gastranaerophilales bacterium]|nr:hypothetical protein [Candidatus Gastranaerophilales bacterium]
MKIIATQLMHPYNNVRGNYQRTQTSTPIRQIPCYNKDTVSFGMAFGDPRKVDFIRYADGNNLILELPNGYSDLGDKIFGDDIRLTGEEDRYTFAQISAGNNFDT